MRLVRLRQEISQQKQQDGNEAKDERAMADAKLQLIIRSKALRGEMDRRRSQVQAEAAQDHRAMEEEEKQRLRERILYLERMRSIQQDQARQNQLASHDAEIQQGLNLRRRRLDDQMREITRIREVINTKKISITQNEHRVKAMREEIERKNAARAQEESARLRLKHQLDAEILQNRQEADRLQAVYKRLQAEKRELNREMQEKQATLRNQQERKRRVAEERERERERERIERERDQPLPPRPQTPIDHPIPAVNQESATLRRLIQRGQADLRYENRVSQATCLQIQKKLLNYKRQQLNPADLKALETLYEQNCISYNLRSLEQIKEANRQMRNLEEMARSLLQQYQGRDYPVEHCRELLQMIGKMHANRWQSVISESLQQLWNRFCKASADPAHPQRIRVIRTIQHQPTPQHIESNRERLLKAKNLYEFGKHKASISPQQCLHLIVLIENQETEEDDIHALLLNSIEDFIQSRCQAEFAVRIAQILKRNRLGDVKIQTDASVQKNQQFQHQGTRYKIESAELGRLIQNPNQQILPKGTVNIPTVKDQLVLEVPFLYVSTEDLKLKEVIKVRRKGFSKTEYELIRSTVMHFPKTGNPRKCVQVSFGVLITLQEAHKRILSKQLLELHLLLETESKPDTTNTKFSFELCRQFKMILMNYLLEDEDDPRIKELEAKFIQKCLAGHQSQQSLNNMLQQSRKEKLQLEAKIENIMAFTVSQDSCKQIRYNLNQLKGLNIFRLRWVKSYLMQCEQEYEQKCRIYINPYNQERERGASIWREELSKQESFSYANAARDTQVVDKLLKIVIKSTEIKLSLEDFCKQLSQQISKPTRRPYLSLYTERLTFVEASYEKRCTGSPYYQISPPLRVRKGDISLYSRQNLYDGQRYVFKGQVYEVFLNQKYCRNVKTIKTPLINFIGDYTMLRIVRALEENIQKSLNSIRKNKKLSRKKCASVTKSLLECEGSEQRIVNLATKYSLIEKARLILQIYCGQKGAQMPSQSKLIKIVDSKIYILVSGKQNLLATTKTEIDKAKTKKKGYYLDKNCVKNVATNEIIQLAEPHDLKLLTAYSAVKANSRDGLRMNFQVQDSIKKILSDEQEKKEWFRVQKNSHLTQTLTQLDSILKEIDNKNKQGIIINHNQCQKLFSLQNHIQTLLNGDLKEQQKNEIVKIQTFWTLIFKKNCVEAKVPLHTLIEDLKQPQKGKLTLAESIEEFKKWDYHLVALQNQQFQLIQQECVELLKLLIYWQNNGKTQLQQIAKQRLALADQESLQAIYAHEQQLIKHFNENCARRFPNLRVAQWENSVH